MNHDKIKEAVKSIYEFSLAEQKLLGLEIPEQAGVMLLYIEGLLFSVINNTKREKILESWDRLFKIGRKEIEEYLKK